MILTTIINADTRDGWLQDRSAIGEYGNVSLCGCRSVDFLTEATIARNRFLDSPLITKRRTILYVDIHNPIPDDVRARLAELLDAGELTAVVEAPHSKDSHRWNDRLYCRALELATDTDLIAHWDGDCIGYRREGFDVLALYLEHLNSGASYVCQQTPLSKEEHKMQHASTRFFLTRAATIDIRDAERLLDDGARRLRFAGRHLPCLEHLLGAMAGDTVLYPSCQNEDFAVWSWVHHFKGTIAKLNGMPYEDVRKYVFETCGGPLGASDLLGVAIP